MLKKAQPDVEFVTEQAPPLGKEDTGAIMQALDDAKPDGIFSAMFGTGLAKFVRDGTTRGTFKNRVVVNLLAGEPEYLDPLKDEAPVGWIVTGYPWNEINTPEHKTFVAAYQKKFERLSAARFDRRLRHHEVARRRHRQGRLHRHREADHGVPRPRGRRRPIRHVHLPRQDHQATVGAYVGKIALKDGKGTMSDFKYVDGVERDADRRRGEEASSGGAVIV